MLNDIVDRCEQTHFLGVCNPPLRTLLWCLGCQTSLRGNDHSSHQSTEPAKINIER